MTTQIATKKANDKYVGVFPFEFDQRGKADEEGVGAIPDTIHIIPIGQWDHPAYGLIIVTASDCREFLQNFNASIRKGVPITAGHEGMLELPAVGWITELECRDTGLWGKVDWNDEGKELLLGKAYKFFSPEFYRDYEDPQTHQMYRNVLVGGALTKAPYFKELEAIVFSEPKYQLSSNTTMNLTDLLAKPIAELNDEEKAFIKEHAAELTDEQKTSHAAVIEEKKEDAPAETDEEKAAREEKEKADAEAAAAKATEEANVAAGLNPDGSAKVDASEKSMTVAISASELAILRAAADQGKQAFAELEKQKLDAAVGALTFSETNRAGKFLPKSTTTLRTFMEKLNEAQRATFATLMAELPKTHLFTENGISGTAAVEGTVQAEVEAKVKAKMSENKELKYSDALRLVFAENEGLTKRYDADVSQPVQA